MRIVMVISSLQAGGAERVFVEMANYWQGKGHEITVITLGLESEDFYRLSPGVVRRALGMRAPSNTMVGAIANNMRRVRGLRREIRKARPQRVISFMDKTNILTLLAGMRLGVKTVVSERIDCRQQHIGHIWNWLRVLLYPRAHAIVVQTEALRAWMIERSYSQRIVCIPNPISESLLAEASYCRGGQRQAIIISVGRLTYQKGQDILLRAFAMLADEFPDWRVVLVGDGPERERLNRLSQALGIQERVSFRGILSNPLLEVQKASVFVMSSRFEGFPNALIEAMACGTAVVSTDCPSGPGEIIRNGVDGILVPNEDGHSLMNAIRTLMLDSALRSRLGEAATGIRGKLNIDHVMQMWETALRA